MSVDFIKHAFIAGEMDPALFGQTNLEKYDQGLALCRNFFVDFKGGIVSRPGSQFVDFVKLDTQATKFFPFAFAPNVANTYVLLFGQEYVRFIQDGAYVLEADKTITGATRADPCVITSASHSFVTGDWVKISGVVGMTELNGFTFEVGATTTNTFEIKTVPDIVDLDSTSYTTYVSGGVANRIYTVATPYAAADLAGLQTEQIRDTIRITSLDYATRNLVRLAETNWTLALEDRSNTVTAPGTLSNETGGTGFGALYTVTSVDLDGQESVAENFIFDIDSEDILTASKSVEIEWAPVDNTQFYNVYRGIWSNRTDSVTVGDDLGYIGTALGSLFIDTGITPDFARTPPVENDPFADGRIETINITNQGTNYRKVDTVSISDPDGSGFVGKPIISDDGGDQKLVGILIIRRGSGYTAPTVSFGTATGSSAAATAVAAPVTGNNPATSAVFQQRQMYANTNNNPLTVYGSRVGQFSNFSGSRVTQDDDAVEFELAAQDASPLRHLVPVRSGLLMMSQTGIWQLTAGTNVPVTPTNALADPQSYNGVSTLPPLTIDVDVLYAEGRGNNLRLLEYDDFRKVFGGKNVTILSGHLITEQADITSWAYASNPHKIIWAVRSDGRLLGFTIEREQEVFAMTQHSTKGMYKDIIYIPEGTQDAIYYMVERIVNGRTSKFIEKQRPRTFDHVEDAWAVDSGLALGSTAPAASLQPAAATGTGITFTASSGVFASGDVGKVIRVGGGKGTIVTFTDTNNVVVDIVRDITNLIPEDASNTVIEALSGEWTMDTPVTAISGFEHLEGQTIVGLADGSVVTGLVVTNGAITLPNAATRFVGGLQFTCIARTLPATSPAGIVESKRIRTVGAGVRFKETRGLKQGESLTNLYEVKEQTVEPYGEPIAVISGYKYTLIQAGFDDDGQTYFVQDNPLPAAILGLVMDQEIGDIENRDSGRG